jgi:hypothetical protein
MSKIILSKYFINDITNIILLYSPLCKICDEFAIYLNIFGNFCNIHAPTCQEKTQDGFHREQKCEERCIQYIKSVDAPKEYYLCYDHYMYCEKCGYKDAGFFYETEYDYDICQKCKDNYFDSYCKSYFNSF